MGDNRTPVEITYTFCYMLATSYAYSCPAKGGFKPKRGYSQSILILHRWCVLTKNASKLNYNFTSSVVFGIASVLHSSSENILVRF